MGRRASRRLARIHVKRRCFERGGLTAPGRTVLFRVRHAADWHSAILVPSLVTIVVFLAFGIWCGWRVLRYDPTPEQAEANAPSGIRGWLVLPAIGVALRRFLILLTLVEWVAFPWVHAISQQPWRCCAYLALLAAICVQLVAGLVGFALFFRKRSSAPVVLVALMWLGWLITLGLGLFNASLGLHNQTFVKALGYASMDFFFVGAWSLYFFGSRRVGPRSYPVDRCPRANLPD